MIFLIVVNLSRGFFVADRQQQGVHHIVHKIQVADLFACTENLQRLIIK